MTDRMRPPIAEQHRILILEDEFGVAMVLSELLESEGYAIRHFADGMAALRATEQWLPHVILLDLTLPGMDGREFARALRDLPAPAAATPVVLITGALGGVESAPELGAQAAIRKPFDLDLVLDTLHGLLASSPASES